MVVAGVGAVSAAGLGADALWAAVTGRPVPSTGAEAALVQQAALALLSSRRPGVTSFASRVGLDELSVRRSGSEGAVVALGKRFADNQAGGLPPQALSDVIRQARELDMDAVRQEVQAAQEAAANGPQDEVGLDDFAAAHSQGAADYRALTEELERSKFFASEAPAATGALTGG